MSKAGYDRLTPADRDLVRKAAKQSVPEMRRLWDAEVAKAKAEVLSSGVAVNEVEKQPFIDLMRPVWSQFITTPQQQKLVDNILAMGGPQA